MLLIKRKFRRHETPSDLVREDLECATQIAAYAGINTRDRRGNLLPEVWVRQADRMSTAQLIADTDLRSLLIDYLKSQFVRYEEPDAQTSPSAEDVVRQREQRVNWVLDTVKTWETEYQKAVNKNFDISQKILSAMYDLYHEVEEAMVAAGMDLDDMRARIQTLHESDSRRYLSGDDGRVRFFFRHPNTKAQFRRTAGRFLQKSEVCNKAGAYSAKVQRNDVTQQRDDALRDLLVFLQFEGHRETDLAEIKASIDDDLAEWIGDPKYTPESSENASVASLHTPPSVVRRRSPVPSRSSSPTSSIASVPAGHV